MTKVDWVRSVWLLGVLAAAASAAPLACSGDNGGTGDASSDVTACGAPLLECGSSCTDPQSDPNNCGACGTKCDTANAEVCSQGTCALACGGGTSKCGGSCFDLQNDQKNCGSCGNACAQGETCSAGKCAIACGAGLSQCGDGGACVDTQVDSLNCGACGNTCGANTSCQAGLCTANLLTTAPVAVSGTLTGCSTASSALGRKAAIDDANHLYVAMICGSTRDVFVATSTNGGISFGAPVATGMTQVSEASIVVSHGAKPTLYVAAGLSASSTTVLTASTDIGKTFTPAMTIDDSSSGGGFGISMDTYKDTLYVESVPVGGGHVLHVLRNGMGAGDAGLDDAGDAGFELTNLFVDAGPGLDPNDIVVNQSNGDVWAIAEDATFFLMQSTNGGASFTGPVSPPGANLYTDWALAKDTIFVVGTGDQLLAIPTSAPTTDTAVSGLGSAAPAQRSLGVDVAGNVYVATPTGTSVKIDRVLFASATSDGGVDGGAVIDSTRNIVALAAVDSPSITSRPVGAALVAYSAAGVVYASVQAY